MPVVVTTGHEVQTCRNCGAPQLQFSTRWPMSLFMQFIDKVWTSPTCCGHTHGERK